MDVDPLDVPVTVFDHRVERASSEVEAGDVPGVGVRVGDQIRRVTVGALVDAGVAHPLAIGQLAALAGPEVEDVEALPDVRVGLHQQESVVVRPQSATSNQPSVWWTHRDLPSTE